MSGIGIAQEDAKDREYLMQVYYISLESNLSRYKIHVMITWNVKTHLAIIKNVYEKMDAVLGLEMPVEFFKSGTITLDIPLAGITIQGWKITPLIYPVVIKMEVDYFREDKSIPCCQLLAEVSGKKKKIPTLRHQVNLKGAKFPNDFFVINLPARDPNLQERSQTFGNLHVVAAAHILTKEELQVLTGLLATDGEENQIRQSIQHGQAEGLTLEEVQRILQDHGKIDAANELKDKLRRGIESIKHFETYQQALQGQKRLSMQYLKFVLFGPPRSGKSSTRRRLIKEINNLRSIGGGSKSTGLAHSSEILIKKMTCSPAAIVMSGDDGDSDWQSLQGSQVSGRNQAEQKADLKYLAQVFYNCILRKAQPSSSHAATRNFIRHKSKWLPVTLNQKRMRKSSDTLDTGHEIEKEVLDDEIERAFEELASILQSDIPEELQKLVENLIMINIIDVGGQPAFLEILPTFSIGSALYLLFFRMDQDPKELYPVQFKEHEDDEETTLDSSYCIEDVLCQSLSCAASLGYTHSLNQLPAQQSISRALLFGTYKDEVERQGTLEACVSNINNDLWRKLSSIKKDLLLTANPKDNFFQVDNMEGNDDIDKIRKEIEKIVCSVYPSIPVPSSWLMFRILLHLLDKPIIDLDRCRMVASKLMMSTDSAAVEEAVWFFHHHVGSLMHFPEIESIKNVVICNPQVIFDSISEVIISTFNIRNRKIPESAVEEFKQKGQFTFEHIECSTKEQRQSCLSPKQLIDVLKYHHIIAEIKAEDGDSQSSPKYIIPAVLNCASEEDLKFIEEERSESTACPLMIQFECGFVPLGIFCAGVSYLIAHQQEKDWILHKNYEVKKNKVMFIVDGTYVVGFISRPKYLEIQIMIVPRASTNRKSLAEMCLTVKQTIISALDAVIWQMKQKTMFRRARDPLFDLSIGFTCTQCSANDDGHLMKVIENEGKCLREGSRHDLQMKHLIWFGQNEIPQPLDTSSADPQKTTSECSSLRLPSHQQSSANIQSQISEGIGSQTRLSIEEAADRVGVRLDVLSKECSDAVSLDLADFCVKWKLIGGRVGLTEGDLTAVDGDNRTVEEKRVGMLKKWKSKFAFNATYRALIEALLAEGRCADAIEACKVIKAAEDMPVKPELIDILKQLYYTAAADKWEDIGIMLNIKIGDLNVIKSADGNKTSHSCLREMFKLYLEKDNPPPSWAAIVEVLEFLEEGTLAENIKSKHCSNQSTTTKRKDDEQETPEAKKTKYYRSSQSATTKRKDEPDEQETPEAKKTKYCSSQSTTTKRKGEPDEQETPEAKKTKYCSSQSATTTKRKDESKPEKKPRKL